MPKIERTERTVGIKHSPYPAVGDGGGRAIGEGISALGAALTKLGAANEEQEMFDAKMKASEYTFQEAKALDDRVANYNPATDGKPDEFDAKYEAERAQRDQAFVSQFKSPRTRQYAMMQTQQARQSSIMRAQNARQAFVQQENIGRVMAHTDRIGSTITGDPESVVAAHKALDGSIEQVPGLTPGQRNQLRAKASRELWQHWLGKADEEQLKRGKAAYERGIEDFEKQFQNDQPSPAGPSGPTRVQGGRIDPVSYHRSMESKIAASPLNGFVPKDGAKFGITTGAPREWARLFSMIVQQESGHKTAPTNPDGSLRRFATTVPTEKSFGPGQFNIGEYGLRTWADVNDPDRVADAIINVTKQHVISGGGMIGGPNNTGLAAYFGSIRRPHETLQHRAWWQKTVMPGLEVARTATEAPESQPPAGDMGGGNDTPPRKMLGLPDRARLGHHAINEFTGLLPKIDKRLAELEAQRIGRQWFSDVVSGNIRLNKHDAEERKTVDTYTGQTDIGKRIFAGDPQAIAQGAMLTDRIGYMPRPVYEALKGMMDDPDMGRRELGYRIMGEALDRTPEAVTPHGDDKGISTRVEHYRLLARVYGGQKALQMIAQENTPEWKQQAKALKTDVDKLMKNYEGDKGQTQIQTDMADGTLRDWWSRPDAGFSPRDRALAIDDYRRILRRELEGGATEEQAKAAAISQFKMTYGVSSMFGQKRVQMYPIDRVYQGKVTPEQMTAEIKTELARTVPGWVEGSEVVRADERTIKELHDWRVGRGPPPSYVVTVQRKDGRGEESRRYRPDIEGAQKKEADEFKAKRDKALTPGTPEQQKQSDQETGRKVGDKTGEILEAPVKAARDAVVREIEAGREQKAQGRDAGLEVQRNPGMRRVNPVDALTPKRAPSVGGQ